MYIHLLIIITVNLEEGRRLLLEFQSSIFCVDLFDLFGFVLFVRFFLMNYITK